MLKWNVDSKSNCYRRVECQPKKRFYVLISLHMQSLNDTDTA